MVSELETPPMVARPMPELSSSNARRFPRAGHSENDSRPWIGVAFGVLLGIGLAFLRDRFDNTVKNRQILEGITGAGLVANIPFDKGRRKDPAISFTSDRSSIAEAFREFRTNLQFLEVDDPPRVLVVTSSLPGG